jgi:hypothetical protein
VAAPAPAPAPATTDTPAPTPPKPVDNRLTEEARRIEGARAALARGQAGAALDELDAYARAFPNGRLGEEASVLRIEALAKFDPPRARVLAEDYLARHAAGAYAPRVRRTLAELPR